MTEFFIRIRHILYRLRTALFSQSRIARWVGEVVWKRPTKGVVTIAYTEDQNILPYFSWSEFEDSVAKTKLRNFTERYAHEPNVVYHIKGDLILEPDYGLAINHGRQFIRESGTLSHVFLKPSYRKYLAHKYFNREYTTYDFVVHSDGFAGINLCHFVYDTINPILFMYQRGMISAKDPILVSEKIFNKTYFGFFMKHSVLGSLNWVVQKQNEWIRTKEIRKAFVSMEIFKTTYNLLSHTHDPRRKIFLDRRSNVQRNLKNIERIRPILKKFGFETVYAEDLTYEQQVALFRDVKYFVGIHGAGMTNLIHSHIPSIYVLEIFAENYIHASFYRFLRILGIKYYDAISGTPLDINWCYEVDEHELHRKIERMMEYENTAS